MHQDQDDQADHDEVVDLSPHDAPVSSLNKDGPRGLNCTAGDSVVLYACKRPPPFLLLPTAFVALCKVLRNVANSFHSAANCPRDPEEKATLLAVACGR